MHTGTYLNAGTYMHDGDGALTYVSLCKKCYEDSKDRTKPPNGKFILL